MTQINWMHEVEKRKEDLIKDTQGLLHIKSLLDEENPSPEAPLGKGVKEALDYMLNLGEKDGFTPKNVGNLAGHLEFGAGEELLGILCHVDVVPEGDGWTSDPFGAEIREGKIFARGALDDKGPTMAAYYAMKIVKELGLPLNKRVRMIIGTDEESNWRCVDHYFKHEEMPTLGFAPDADFPIINAEKGIADFDMVQQQQSEDTKEAMIEVESFVSGKRYNMVPDLAQATIFVNEYEEETVRQFTEFMTKYELEHRYQLENGKLLLEVKGISAHGMEPRNGKNAGLFLVEFLSKLNVDARTSHYFKFVSRYFFEDSRGVNLGVAYSDDVSGELTINPGKLSYSKDTNGRIGMTCRYPVTNKMGETKARLEELLQKEGFVLDNFSDSKPHFVDEKEFLIQTLKKVYEEQTGENAELIAIGGGTYARSLKAGVAFGPLFPGRPDIAHQKDEYMYIEDLLKATAIYAQAIYELAKGE
ncbi:succinyl-diaminopimelate desuccinylase [Bacillus sp. SORGH_AS 510]|uniref:dipeptidase PepV n=1 Tax=Bacillus sp. SORGH_AS_0510 TaxID=3041771 RepID=UPI002788D1A7|nr:dipeptidase PepV [Bacillus sp. SORGH_AS_0510]MDQ1144696.1 succinyl-diaminopimelate desuccinylase [Bacillus sp. SORGH_AS_0510]